MYFVAKIEIFFMQKQLLWYFITKLIRICQTPFSLMCPLRKTKTGFRFLFEQVSLSGVLFV